MVRLSKFAKTTFAVSFAVLLASSSSNTMITSVNAAMCATIEEYPNTNCNGEEKTDTTSNLASGSCTEMSGSSMIVSEFKCTNGKLEQVQKSYTDTACSTGESETVTDYTDKCVASVSANGKSDKYKSCTNEMCPGSVAQGRMGGGGLTVTTVVGSVVGVSLTTLGIWLFM